jgi:tetratricopeptide (TPR) repeat protein
VTFWALGEMVRKRAGLAETDDEETTRARIRETVAEYVPEQEDRDWVEPALLTLLGLEPAPAGGRDVLFSAWRIFFERIAAKGTTVMLFEDLQWADGGQLDFIDHVMEWSKGVPLLVVTLARPELLERRPGWGTSARSFNTIGLEPLTDDQMRDLLLGLVPEMQGPAVETVVARADGIPLYAVETVRMLIADGRLVPDGSGTFEPSGDLGELAVPDSLRALVAARLDALPPEDRALLQDAAILGKTFAADALAAISGEDETSLEPWLRTLVKRELLEISVDLRSPERGQYGFVQSVIREVAYDTLSRRDRRSRHLAAARYFEGMGDDELAGVLSTHYLAAYEASEAGPEADALQIQARLALRGAADRAMALGAADQAITCLRQALDITAAAADRAVLLERAAEAAVMEGRYEEAEELGFEAIAAFEEAGDRSGAARTSALMGGILADASKITETVEFLEAAIARADRPEDEDVRADMLSRLSRAYMRLTETESAIRRADEALRISEPRRLDRITAEAFVNKGAALSFAGRLREPAILLEEAIRLAAKVGDMTLELRARNNLAAVLGSDDGRASLRVARETYELANRLGVRQMSQWIMGAIAYGSLHEGLDWDTALSDLDAEIEVSQSVVDRARLLGIRETLMVWRGEDRTDVAAERSSWSDSSSDPDARAWSVVLPAVEDLVAGRPQAAIDPFLEGMAMSSQSVWDVRFDLILAAHWARDVEVARKGLREAEAESDAGTFHHGVRALARGGVAALEGERNDALRDFRSAIAAFEKTGALFQVALTQLDALILLPGEPSIADWADQARERFETLKARPLLERLDEAVATRVGV